MNITSRERRLLAAGVIGLITLVSYLPALRAGFIWDDDYHVAENQTLRTVHGLVRIWTEPGAVPQYYPLVHTAFWVEYHLWGVNPFGYHLVNVLLQALNGILLWLVLDRLRVRGAWLAAAVFAVHPIQVESVAWITERKNVLSCAFYLAALMAYGRFSALWEGEAPAEPVPGRGSAGASPSLNDQTALQQQRDWRYYFLAFGLFVCALLSKTVTCSLPVAILLLIWWKRGRIGWRDVWPLAPFFAVGAGLGLTTAWIEKHRVGALGTEWSYTVVERVLIAGRALWFYASKLVWPRDLTFMYPRWQILTGQWWQWLFPLGFAGVVIALWKGRERWGRGPLAAVLFFAATLGPALGFVDVFPMRYSFVADHFQYLASMGLIAALVAALASVVRGRSLRIAASVAVLACLCVLTWRQSEVYRDPETLWRDTLAKNPDCWMAHNNLGVLLAARGEETAARAEYQQALRIKPDFYEPYNNLGNLLRKQGRTEDSLAEYRHALRLEPRYVLARYNLAVALGQLGEVDEAIAEYHLALLMKPDYGDAHYNLGIALGRQGRFAEACEEFSQAAQDQPDPAKAQYNWGFALAKQADFAQAVVHYRAALRLSPDFAAAHYGLGVALLQQGQRAGAIRELQVAVRLEPDSREARSALASLL